MNKIDNKLNNFKFFMGSPALVWQILFLAIPFIFIFFVSFFTTNFEFNISYFFSIINFDHLKIISRTLLVSFFNTILCLLIAYPIAYFLAFRTGKHKNLWLTFLMLPLWVNFLVQVYAWFFVLEQNGIINSTLLTLGIISSPLHLINNIFAITIVMVHVYLPFMIMPLYNVLEKFDFQLIEASEDLGASKWQTFKKITFPLSLPGVYLGFFLVFVMSFGEVAIPVLLGGNKTFFVGSLISQYFLGVRNVPKGSAFTLLSLIILVATMFLLYLIFRKKRSLEVAK
jgi:spermidine/putrescine transport system permease protein